MPDAVLIRPLDVTDFDVASSWLSDPSLNRWLTAEWRGRTVTASVLAMVLRNRRNRMLMVEHEGEPVGLVGLADIDDADGTAMIWYIKGVHTTARRGEMSIGVGLTVQWAFEHLGLHSVYAWIMADNAPSRRLLERIGFQQAGVLRKATRSGDQQVDRIYFDIVK